MRQSALGRADYRRYQGWLYDLGMNPMPNSQWDAEAHNMLPGEPMLTRTPVAMTVEGSTQRGWLYYGIDGLVFFARFSLYPNGPATETLADRRMYTELGRAEMSARAFSRSAHVSFASGVQFDGEKAHIKNLAKLSAIITGN
jgi:hypothetical protein